MPSTTVKGGEVGAVDTNWEGTSGLEFLFLTRLNGGWLEAAEIIVCSMLVAYDKTDMVSRGDGLTSKVLDLKGGSHWLTGAWSGIRESDTLGESGIGKDGELRPITNTSWCWHRVLCLGPSYPLIASDYHRIAQRRLYTCPVCQKDDLAKTAHYHLEQFPLSIDSRGHGSRHVGPE